MERIRVQDHIRTMVRVWLASKQPELSEAQVKAAANAAKALADTKDATLTTDQLQALLEAEKALSSS